MKTQEKVIVIWILIVKERLKKLKQAKIDAKAEIDSFRESQMEILEKLKQDSEEQDSKVNVLNHEKINVMESIK